MLTACLFPDSMLWSDGLLFSYHCLFDLLKRWLVIQLPLFIWLVELARRTEQIFSYFSIRFFIWKICRRIYKFLMFLASNALLLDVLGHKANRIWQSWISQKLQNVAAPWPIQLDFNQLDLNVSGIFAEEELIVFVIFTSFKDFSRLAYA